MYLLVESRIKRNIGVGTRAPQQLAFEARIRWFYAPAALRRGSAEGGALASGASARESLLTLSYGQTWPASVRKVPLFENQPLIPTEGAPKNHEKNASSCR